MSSPSLEAPFAGTRSYFRTRTASVSLKIDIHPPHGININHVEGESSHSTVVKQGEEILHFTVYSELKESGIQIPKGSLLHQSLLCTSKGFLLLRWESLCKTIYQFMRDNHPEAPLKCFINKRCHCARRLRPQGCNGFLCLALAQLSEDESFSQRVAKLLYHTVCACRWSLQMEDPALLDKILSDSLSAIDIICAEHDLTCLGGWGCVTPHSKRTLLRKSNLDHKRGQPLVLAITAAGIIVVSFIIFRLYSCRTS